MVYFAWVRPDSYFQPTHYVFSMALIKQTRSVVLLIFLIVFSAAVLAQLDPEILKQIGFSEALLNKNEKIISRRHEFTVVELKEIVQSANRVRSQAKACIASNEYSIEKIITDIEQLGEVI